MIAASAFSILPTTFAWAQETGGTQTPANGTQTPANSTPAAASSPPSSGTGTITGPGTGTTTGTDSTTNANGHEAAVASTEGEAPLSTTLSAGLDVYSGVSNLDGQRRFSDGFWAAGASLAYPSAAYLKLQQKNGSAAKFSIGTGDLYRGSSSTVKQPIEAWYQKPVGKYTVTAGKYWVPFALQEWQYETKFGVQLQRATGASDYVASVNYDRAKNRPNIYFRGGRNFSEKVNVGASFAAGEGLSYGSIHNKAIGLDATFQVKNFKAFSEILAMQRRSSDRFYFIYSKLVYDRYARVKPFVSYYKWNDKSGAFGDFRSIAYGATVELTPDLLIEGGGAATADKNIFWIQFHYLLERTVFRGKTPAISVLPRMPRP